MSNRTLGLILATLVCMTDQISKYIVLVPLDLKFVREIDLLPFFQLTWVANYGVSLGMLDFRCGPPETLPFDMIETCNRVRWGLVVLTGVIATSVAVRLWRERNRQDAVGLGLVLGGAIGNILDRVRFGHVVDFADLHFGAFRPFLVFNVADAAITIGVLILVFRAFLSRDKSKASPDA